MSSHFFYYPLENHYFLYHLLIFTKAKALDSKTPELDSESKALALEILKKSGKEFQ
ncbi:hypothetical protein BGP_5520 [Beggiatoa sp. PS]|nr:hypothetical protein BGP_5520 [Beggiatoa sp. PS]